MDDELKKEIQEKKELSHVPEEEMKKLKEEKDLVKKHPAPIRQLEVINLLKELNNELKNLTKEIDELLTK